MYEITKSVWQVQMAILIIPHRCVSAHMGKHAHSPGVLLYRQCIITVSVNLQFENKGLTLKHGTPFIPINHKTYHSVAQESARQVITIIDRKKYEHLEDLNPKADSLLFAAVLLLLQPIQIEEVNPVFQTGGLKKVV